MKTKIDDKIEKLTTAVQKKLEGNPVLLIGSGASIPYGLPSMGSLAVEITGQLNPKYEAEDSWKAFIAELDASGNLEAALGKVTLKEEIHRALITTIWSFIDSKDRSAIIGFLRDGTAPALTSILRKFVQQTGNTNIVTTNYDRLVEYAIDSASGIVETGFSGHCMRAFGFLQKNGVKRLCNLFKVHGSIDWFRHKANQSILATSFFEQSALSDLYDPMIVTPGIEKFRQTHNDPFRTVITEADKALRSSSSYLCVGYGFNDEHIQPIIIDENRSRKKPIVIVTKEITPKMRELFLQSNSCNSLIISEKSVGGSIVNYSNLESESFAENYWQLDAFYKLWLE